MSTPEELAALHTRAQELFEELCDRSSTEQDAWFKNSRDETTELYPLLRKILESDRSHDAGARGSPSLESESDSAQSPFTIPETIDGFRLIERIGSGGMGVVYRAEQDQPNRQVALKLLRSELATPEVIRRFELEAEALGRLNHNGIASIHAVGTTKSESGSQPYFAMELVEGESIVDYVENSQLNTNQVLDLVAQVADAMVHAHQKGVIHRDLKPANILVTLNGQPKILDFGIARVADLESERSALLTQTGEMMGTLAYMSPEQLSGNPHSIDLRTDVYALGVLLYELLAGKRPFDTTGKSIANVIRTVLETDAVPLGKHNVAYAGDIESIVRKAMEQESTRRYGSAGELAQDLRKHLAYETVSARPPTASYRVRKFVRRNRGLVVATSAVLAALITTTAVSVYQAVRVNAAFEDRGVALVERSIALEARGKALAEKDSALIERTTALAEKTLALEDSNITIDFFSTMLEEADSYKSGKVTTLRDFLGGSARSIDTRYSARPLVAARLKHSIGKALYGAGGAKKGESLLRQAHAVFSEQLGKSNPATLSALSDLARTLAGLSQWEEAGAAFDQVIATGIEAYGPEHPTVVIAQADKMFRVQQFTGAVSDLLAEAEELLPTLERVLGEDHHETTLVRRTIGHQLLNKNRVEEAAVHMQLVLESRERSYGKDHPLVADTMTSLITAYTMLKRFEEADSLVHRSRTIYENTTGLNHRNALHNQGAGLTLLTVQGKAQEAVPLARDLLQRHVDTLGEDSQYTFQMILTAAPVFANADLGQEACDWSKRGVAIARKVFPKEHYATAYALSEYAHLLLGDGQLELSIQAAEESIQMLEEFGGPPGMKIQTQESLEIARTLLSEKSDDY